MFQEYADMREASRLLRQHMKIMFNDSGPTAWELNCEKLHRLERDLARKNKIWEMAAVAFAQNRENELKDFRMLKVEVLQGELVKGTTGSAGYDLSSTEDYTIPIGGQQLIMVGLITRMSHGLFGKIFDRSGMALKKRLTTRAGVIDADYPREWGVILVNESDSVQEIKRGDRVAQVVFQTYVDVGGVILEPDRTAGFGSTGGGVISKPESTPAKESTGGGV